MPGTKQRFESGLANGALAKEFIDLGTDIGEFIGSHEALAQLK